ncbi:MAG: alpha/beta hydrolase [Proteobacteria bacterium]|nr:alpha/beta hydrolase [Pseudomonadota bacterium]MYJ96255.1 alpha/beta hydrolase [Pseudomonadota bacterium]
MIEDSKLTRRTMMKWSMLSASASAMAGALRAPASAQDLGPGNAHVGDVGGRDPARLYTGEPIEGGGQMEIRLNQSIHTDDPHELEVARRMRPFDPLSWYTEWNRVAQINEEIAVGYEEQGLNVSAHNFYLRASRFHRLSIVYQEDTDETMMPGYMKYREFFDKAWELQDPPFERVTINVDGNDLLAYFRKPGGPEGTRYPTVINYQGADSLAENTLNGSGAYVARGMAYLVMDLPGQGAPKRLMNLHMPPDTERLVSPIIDYLQSRPDVDPERIGLRGQSMGGYSAPRAASGESRIKAVWMGAGSHDVLRDLFEFYPPIRDRVRWIIGAEDLADARRKLVDYTVEHVAHQIECPMLIGYGPTDRIMDPQGAYRLYQAAVNSDRQMWSGAGHPHHDEKSGGPLDLRLPTGEDWAARQLGAPG